MFLMVNNDIIAFRIAGTKVRKINETTKYFSDYLC